MPAYITSIILFIAYALSINTSDNSTDTTNIPEPITKTAENDLSMSVNLNHPTEKTVRKLSVVMGIKMALILPHRNVALQFSVFFVIILFETFDLSF